MTGEADREPRPRLMYRAATRQDLYEVARVYLRAFPDSLRALHAPHLTPLAVADVMRAVLEADPGAIIMAMAPAGEVVGYIIAATDTSGVAHAAVSRGLILRWLWRWLRGMYHLPLAGAWTLLRDKLRLRDAWQIEGADCPARIVSLAVDPDWQRRGLGRDLLLAGLRRLRAQGRTFVRLEVRPGNTAARHLYEGTGFREMGRVADSRGEWIVMVGSTDRLEAPAP